MIDKYFHKFILKPYYFDNLSMIHGFNHTFRVMVNVLTIGNAIGLNNEVKEAFCAAFVHDMSRKMMAIVLSMGFGQLRIKFLYSLIFSRSGYRQNWYGEYKTCSNPTQ